MKTIRYIFFLLLLAALPLAISARDVIITYNDNTTKTIQTDNISRITFTMVGSFQMMITYTGGSRDLIDIAKVKEVSFPKTTDADKAKVEYWKYKMMLEKQPRGWVGQRTIGNATDYAAYTFEPDSVTVWVDADEAGVTGKNSYTVTYYYYDIWGSRRDFLLQTGELNNYDFGKYGWGYNWAIQQNSTAEHFFMHETANTGYRIDLMAVPEGYTQETYIDTLKTVAEVFDYPKWYIVHRNDTLPVALQPAKRLATVTLPKDDGGTTSSELHYYFTPEGLRFETPIEHLGQQIEGFRYAENSLKHEGIGASDAVLHCDATPLVQLLRENYWYINSEEDFGPVAYPVFRHVADTIYNSNGETKGEECYWTRLGKPYFTNTSEGAIYFCYSSGGYVSEAEYVWEAIGNDAIRFTDYAPTLSTSYNNWRYYRPFGLDKCAECFLGTFDLETDYIKNPTCIILKDRDNPANVIKLMKEGKAYPLGKHE